MEKISVLSDRLLKIPINRYKIKGEIIETVFIGRAKWAGIIEEIVELEEKLEARVSIEQIQVAIDEGRLDEPLSVEEPE